MNSEERGFVYFDAFAGKGLYGARETTESSQKSDPPRGDLPFNESYGSPIVALHALFSIMEKYKKDEKTVLFVFEDFKRKNLNALKNNVSDYLKERSKQDDRGGFISQEDKFIEFKISNCSSGERSFAIAQIYFICSKFEDFDIGSVVNNIANIPVISVVDPFGFSHTPLENVQKLLQGRQKELVITFMVRDIHRFTYDEKKKGNLDRLFGDQEWRDSLSETNKVNKKHQQYQQIYRQIMETTLPRKYESVSFGMRGKEDSQYIYYLIYFADNISSFVDIKYAFNVASNREPTDQYEECFFSDSRFDEENQKWYPLKSVENEADFIYFRLQGKKLSFGDYKKWVLFKTPLQIHAGPLKRLEKDQKLKVTVRPWVTRTIKKGSGVFPPKIYGGIEEFVHNTRNPTFDWELEFKSAEDDMYDDRRC